MTHDHLHRLLDSLILGEISHEDHASLQGLLKRDRDARAIFRERMDLEAGLQTWATESTRAANQAAGTSANGSIADLDLSYRCLHLAIGMAAALLIVIGLLTWNPFFPATLNPLADESRQQLISTIPATPDFVGFIQQPGGCEWRVQPVSASGRFALGKLELAEGIVELRFDSGTDVTLVGPCELEITSIDSALLITGDVYVNVGELSNGFTLTTPVSRIIDEGTEYAVSLDSDSTEVHVFDGSVIWIPMMEGGQKDSPELIDRIDAGEARSYLRQEPSKPNWIPFGQRQFVRRLEDAVKDTGGIALIAYDGFENLAGRIRRGRSGFGWSGGWHTAGRERGKTAEVIDCTEGIVFGLDRSQRRMMLLEQGADIQRDLKQPLEFIAGENIYVGILFANQASESENDGLSLQVSLEPDLPGRGRRLHQVVSFGMASDGFPFIRSSNRVTQTAVRLDTHETVFCVLKLAVEGETTRPFLRIYRPDEAIDSTEPAAWTVTGKPGSLDYPAASVRITVGRNAAWQIDELKIGKSWQSIQTKID